MSQTFAAGRHTLVLTLGDGASVERVRIEMKKSEPADYVATLKRLGFDQGADGPVARSRALDAIGFVREQRRNLVVSRCGDVPLEELPTPLPTQVAGAATGTEPATQPPSRAEPPLGLPILPPQPPASGTSPRGGV
jgi:hypothetical protein